MQHRPNKSESEAEYAARSQQRWWLIILLLLMLIACGIFSAAQWAIISGLRDRIPAGILTDDRANYQFQESDLSVIPQLDPEIIAEATRDAQGLLQTPTQRPQLAVGDPFIWWRNCRDSCNPNTHHRVSNSHEHPASHVYSKRDPR